MLGYPEYADAAWHRTTKFIFTERCVSKDPTIIPTYARAILFYGCPVVRVNTPGLLQQSHVWYCWWTDAKASSSSGPERSRTSDHRRSTAQPHIACSPAAALDSSSPKSSVQAGRASVQSAAVLDGRLSTRCRFWSPSTTVIWRRHMFTATDPHVPRRLCVWCCRTTSVERFADQPPSASPIPIDLFAEFRADAATMTGTQTHVSQTAFNNVDEFKSR